ncbi:MAG TPA: nucleotidyltransferase [Thermaerobacter sp.]
MTAAGVGDRPAVVAAGPVVADVSPVARAAGLRPGMRVRTARRLLPGLMVVPRDAIDPLAALEPLYEALLGISPRVEPVVDRLAALCELDARQTVEEVVAVLEAAGLGRRGHRLVLGIGHGRLVARMAARVAARSRAGTAGGEESPTWDHPGPAARRAATGRRGRGPRRDEAGGGVVSGSGRAAARRVGGVAGPARVGAGPTRVRGTAVPRTAMPVAGTGGSLVVASCRVPPGQEAAFLASMPVAALEEEVPPAARRRLRRLGLMTLGDVAAAPRQVVARAVGDLAPLLQAWCRGDDRRPVAPGFPPPGVTATLAAPPELPEDRRAGWWPAHLPHLAQEVASRLAAAGRAGRLAVLQGERARASRYLPGAVADGDALGRAALDLYRRLLGDEPAPARLALTVTALEPVARQLALADLAAQGRGTLALRGRPATGEPNPGYRSRQGQEPVPASPGERAPAARAPGSRGPGEPTPAGRGAARPVLAMPALPMLVDELARRYPGRIFWGRERPATRRERQLAYWDPWRGAPGGLGP